MRSGVSQKLTYLDLSCEIQANASCHLLQTRRALVGSANSSPPVPDLQ